MKVKDIIAELTISYSQDDEIFVMTDAIKTIGATL
jgi:hypothetical protein